MRKTSYAVTFVAAAAILVLNVLSVRSPEWIIVKYPEIFRSKVTDYYGLTDKCQLQVVRIPNPSESGHLDYTTYSCREFPDNATDHCDQENSAFCIAWTSAGYVSQIAIGFVSMSLVAILFGLTTHSRRRRIWRAVAGLVSLQTSLQIVCFALVTDTYRNSTFQPFEQGRPGIGYVLNTVSWVLGVLTTGAVIMTGLAADKGHQWAAGNRAYQPIEG
ncbi:hypothetical protein HGRIS_002148 [Hohenbuehelia grisea]|uniref:Uncharacterized protein n=1 Tax=Hohenbuehelia grisea TaxID=104357 RepID=A0ABR3JJQ6_9AGAR